MEMELIIKILGSIGAVIAAIFAIRKFYKWLFPISVNPSFSISMDGSKLNIIKANIVNRSSETLYVVECKARGTYSFFHIFMLHIKNPFISPKLYQNIWYKGASYELTSDNPVKLESNQPVELIHKIYEHPISSMSTPYFIVIVKLSSGRIIRSKKHWAPESWQHIGKNYA